MIEETFATLSGFGAKGRYIFEYMGGVSRLAGATIARSFRRPFPVRDTIYQIEAIGIKSLAIANNGELSGTVRRIAVMAGVTSG